MLFLFYDQTWMMNTNINGIESIISRTLQPFENIKYRMHQDAFKDIPANMIPVVKNMMVFILLGYYVIFFFYIRNLFNLMKQITPFNRRINPSLIWLLLFYFLNVVAIIPLFVPTELPKLYASILEGIGIASNVFYMVFTFFVVNKIAESLDAELKSRRIPNEIKPTLAIGTFMCVCNAATLLAGISVLAIIGVLASLAGFIAWIMYWVKTNEYRNRLKVLPPANNLEDLGIF